MRERIPTRRSGSLARNGTLALLVSGVLLVTACSGDGSGTDTSSDADPSGESTPAARAYPGVPEEIAQQRIEWDSCEEPTVAQGGGLLPSGAPGDLADGTPWQCGDVTVPLDYDDPEGATIELAVIRAATTAAEEERNGSLVFNFGGPGQSGVTGMLQLASEYEELRSGYDLVSFDPRGVGESAGVACWDDEATDRASQEAGALPRDAADLAEQTALHQEYIAACEENSGELLPHLTTVNTARDLDLLRHVLGDSQLHYFGISYGTELGGVYAHHFPDHVGRTVLDAPVDPQADYAEQVTAQAEGFQLALENYLAHCSEERGADCPTGGDPAQGTETLADFLDEVAEEPLPTAEDRQLTEELAVNGIAAALYDQESWGLLTQALEGALSDGEGSMLLAFSDVLNMRDPEGRYGNQADAQTAITCADTSGGRDPDAVEEQRDAFEESSPVFGRFLLPALAGCQDWPVNDGQETPEVSAEGASDILLVGTTGDPATPYEGAERMQEALGGDTGVLLTYHGEGHGAYGADPCIDETVQEYLLDGMVPQDGLACG